MRTSRSLGTHRSPRISALPDASFAPERPVVVGRAAEERDLPVGYVKGGLPRVFPLALEYAQNVSVEVVAASQGVRTLGGRSDRPGATE